MIIFDSETTNLLKTELADIKDQPYIIEIAAVKLDHKYREIDEFETLVKPGIPIDDEEHKKITGLTNADLADKPIFLELYQKLAAFFLGETTMIAHNLPFDHGMLVTEMKRIGKEYAFPWPTNQICTVQQTTHLMGRRLKLTELYEHTMKKKLNQKHRAMADVKALIEVVRKLKCS